MEATPHAPSTSRPSELEAGYEGLRALADLLTCVDEHRWASVARPSAKGLGMLMHACLGRLDEGLETLAA